jgi:hypothetical protein
VIPEIRHTLKPEFPIQTMRSRAPSQLARAETDIDEADCDPRGGANGKRKTEA